jgi:hypothetical protein
MLLFISGKEQMGMPGWVDLLGFQSLNNVLFLPILFWLFYCFGVLKFSINLKNFYI